LGRTCLEEAWVTDKKRNINRDKRIEENPVGSRPLGRPRLRWEDYIKNDTEKMEAYGHWRDLAENKDRW